MRELGNLLSMNNNKFIKRKIKEIRNSIGNNRAVVACSGGVDSVTCAILAHKAIGKKLLTVFIDDGLMRENEPQKVVSFLKKFGLKTRRINAQKRFFSSLKGITDPEIKRKAFRETFYHVLGEVVKRERSGFLIQGTIRADIMETKAKIKTQHNVLEQIGISPKKYGLTIVEPLKNLLKPQVRIIAKTLRLPKAIYERMAFPGPGLATRVVGEVTPDRIKIVRQATEIIEKKLIKFKPFQVFAVLLADKATGIKNRKRVLGDIIVIRSIDSQDALQGKPTKIPLEVLFAVQKIIILEISEVSRVLYDLTPKPPATIEYI